MWRSYFCGHWVELTYFEQLMANASGQGGVPVGLKVGSVRKTAAESGHSLRMA